MSSNLAHCLTCGIIFTTGLFSTYNASASSPEVFALSEIQMLSEPEPLRTTLDRWGSEFKRGERQWAYANLEVGVRYKGIEVAVQQRGSADLRLNKQAAEFYGRLDRNELLNPGETVPVHIEVNAFSAQGLRLGYRHQSTNWEVSGGMSLLQASNLMSGTLEGGFVVLGEKDYDFNAAVDYYYYRDPIFHRPNIIESTGIGRAFQLSGEWQLTDKWRIRAQAADLFANIRWKNAPFTEAQAHTDRKDYDEEGFAIFNPLFSGFEGYETLIQELDPRYQIDVAYSYGSWSAHAQGRRQFDYDYAGVGAGYTFSSETSLRALLWPKLGSVGIELEQGRLVVAVSLDHPAPAQMQFLNLRFSYGY